MRFAAVLVAAGRGERAGGGLPKQFLPLGGESVLRRTLRPFVAHPQIEAIQPVIDPVFDAEYRAAAESLGKLLPPVAGGKTRQQSVRAGLEALSRNAPEFVLVHDAARPFVSEGLLDRALHAVRSAGAAVPAVPVSDTVKRIDATGRVAETLDRTSLRAIQTPQAFAFAPLLEAHRRAAEARRHDFTDDAALLEWAGSPVATFEGDPANLKLTTADDFTRANALMAASLGDIRTGTGFDVHAFGPGDFVMLGGVKVRHTKSLVGHSDADVLLHAITDAVLGALAEGDIGKHFPPSDPQWRGAASNQFLTHAVALVAARGGRIAHLDATILCEAPKIAPHADTIRASVAAIAGIDASRVSVKATTTEGLGFLGRGEGIAAMATATVRLPWGAA
ncbi:MAG: bifunctional 2-C-methyl-D-erythritol 4-phosphate cytidylyltransferase/2-C-methyl-D-erythritol 2,4-cyclodiphosphate synthase [Bradyrhizobiaceae bacterium]|nr:bifunctional 2-C-methyl-D-erythritol 4-phosphate cytidylyltransferase/2-C-methyl-D-erythritol 2,4-cyclodiphosphate synthase [Bradyrhizobiaceae bacterium]